MVGSLDRFTGDPCTVKQCTGHQCAGKASTTEHHRRILCGCLQKMSAPYVQHLSSTFIHNTAAHWPNAPAHDVGEKIFSLSWERNYQRESTARKKNPRK